MLRRCPCRSCCNGQPLPADMRRRGAVLAIAGVVDRDHPAGVWCGRWIIHRQLQLPPNDRVTVPCGIRQEVLQPLHRSMLRPGDRLRPGQAGHVLFRSPGEQAGQILPKPAPLRQPGTTRRNTPRSPPPDPQQAGTLHELPSAPTFDRTPAERNTPTGEMLQRQQNNVRRRPGRSRMPGPRPGHGRGHRSWSSPETRAS